jgi:sugar phosphate isomerase/epimerase
MMDIAYFTKALQGLRLDAAAAATADIGFDCVDLLIRDGHAVTPDAPEGVALAVAAYAAEGLRTVMATIDATRPDDATERLLGSCRDAGIGLVRLGFWRYDPAPGWPVLVDMARRDLDGFERLAERLGIRLLLQLHGGSIHASGAQAAHLLAGRDPARIGAYPDPGNQSIQEGSEAWRVTLDILAPWLCCIGVKNGDWSAGGYRPSGQREWRAEWCALDEGMVPWDDIVRHLVTSSFQGPFSMHSHYRVPRDQALAKVRADLSYFRRLIAGATP